jgi:hypothetical protein
MDVYIDDNPVKVDLQGEKTVGEFFMSLEPLLTNEGVRVTNLEIDGYPVPPLEIEDAFKKELNCIESIAVRTMNISELSYTALQFAVRLAEDDSDNVSEKINIWNDGAEKSFLFENYNGIARNIDLYLHSGSEGNNLKKSDILMMLEDAKNEIIYPENSILALEDEANDIIAKLENLGLEIQLAHDKIAGSTILAFTNFSEKIIRLIKFLPLQIQNETLHEWTQNFDKSLNEFLHAYENNDTIMTGDLAEYEISPELKLLFKLLKK